jgi:hypothetical protein
VNKNVQNVKDVHNRKLYLTKTERNARFIDTMTTGVEVTSLNNYQ